MHHEMKHLAARWSSLEEQRCCGTVDRLRAEMPRFMPELGIDRMVHRR